MRPNPMYKNRSGIYGIRNTVNNKVYVGKTNCLYRRCGQYMYDFRHRRINHLNEHLLNAMSKYGIAQFEFFPLEFCDTSALSERELTWMDTLNTTDRDRGYNLRRDSASGMLAHDETIAKISGNLKRQWASGIRSQHGDLMRSSWAGDPQRRSNQALVMRTALTKYRYTVEAMDGTVTACNYQGLRAAGLATVLSNFHRLKSDSARCKGFVVTRVRIENV